MVTTIAEAEPLGPATPMDALLIAPCTGNTLAKLANGITDTSVTMAAKGPYAKRPAGNDRPVHQRRALRLGGEHRQAPEPQRRLLRVPFRQDDPEQKNPVAFRPTFPFLDETVQAALRGWQIQPILK
ncbi:MAG: flavoprotein [Oscillospiraceae bacterium]